MCCAKKGGLRGSRPRVRRRGKEGVWVQMARRRGPERTGEGGRGSEQDADDEEEEGWEGCRGACIVPRRGFEGVRGPECAGEGRRVWVQMVRRRGPECTGDGGRGSEQDADNEEEGGEGWEGC
jgi:hypothetical protein